MISVIDPAAGGAGGTRELCVPLAPHESQVKVDQPQQGARENQNVDDVQSEMISVPGNSLSTE
jgi:hypothetical protein